EHEPALQTPGARAFAAAGLRPLPSGVKQARTILRRERLLAAPEPEPGQEQEQEHQATVASEGDSARRPRRFGRRPRRDAGHGAPVLRLRGVWHELRDGPAILRGVDLQLHAGEAVVLMGRNGAGKSTLLRHAGGLMEPTRGRVELEGELALLLQNPGDLFIHEHVNEEAPAEALRSLGLDGLGERNPRDLSSGQRQRLALAVVLGGERAPSAIALDEPTRGMDREAKRSLAQWLSAQARDGALVLVATHDCEFAVEFATRVVLLARGRVVADGPVAEVLSGGRYFTTESARILGGEENVVRVEEAATTLLARRTAITGPGAAAEAAVGAGLAEAGT
ncbi:MAG TPA: ATP-binding cassette domain-containing protein, partial [Myxococcales bacterium]|nr:ATP-binding cassette domain-containing protein [Myxococcales bacterium]